MAGKVASFLRLVKNGSVSETATQPNATHVEAQAGPTADGGAPAKLRVAWIAGQETLERFGRTLYPLAIGLMDEMVDLVVVGPEGIDFAVLPSPPMELLPHGRLRWWKFDTGETDSLAERLKARKVKLLHALDAGTARLAGALAEKLDIDYVVSCYAVGDGSALGTLDDRAVAVLPASEPVRAALLAGHVSSEDRIRLVRPGVYHSRHADCFTDPGNSVAIVAAGDMDEYEPFHAVLRTFRELRDRKFDCVFFMIGNGRAESSLRQQARKLDLREVLTFVDRMPTSRLTDVFKAADIFISPMAAQTIDMSSLLAMAAGVPVLATAKRPCDFLIDCQTAMLFNQSDASELTVKLLALLDDKAAARALAESALDYVQAHHSPAEMVSAVAQAYRRSMR